MELNEQIGIARQAGFSDEEITAHFLKKAGYSVDEKAEEISMEMPKIAGMYGTVGDRLEKRLIKYPNLYGAYGAVVGTAKELTKFSYLKYLHPEEVEKFKELSVDKQTRQLLIDNLELITAGTIGPIAKGAAPILAKYLPKTYKFLTKPRLVKPSKLEKPSTVDKVESMYDESLKASKQIGKATPGKIYRELKSKFVDVSGNIKKDLLKQGDLGKEAVIRHDLIAGAHPRALQIFDDVEKEIFKGLNSFEQKYLDRVIQSRRTIAIETYKDIKHPKGLGASEHQQWLDTLPPKLSTKLNERADAYFTIMRSQTKQLLDEGLINKEGYQTLIEHEYSPRQFLQHLDPERTFNVGGGRKISVPDSGIKRLEEGSEGLLLNNSKLLLEQVISRTQGRIFRNRANKALYDIADKIPDNGIVRKVKVIGKKTEKQPELLYHGANQVGAKAIEKQGYLGGYTGRVFLTPSKTLAKGYAKSEGPKGKVFAIKKSDMPPELLAEGQGPFSIPQKQLMDLRIPIYKPKTKLIYEKTPAGHEKVSVMIDGQAKDMLMPVKMAGEWVTKNPEISPELANFVGWISGNKILKPMATGLNPEFALTNFPRDIAHVWLTTHEYSSFLPVTFPQMGRDLASVMGDVILRKGAWKDYIHQGGGMEFLTHQGHITSKPKGALNAVQKALGWFGETSEIATRLMLRKRALRNGATPQEATWIARNYLDFSQGGSWAKAADTGIPYLNAGIQGTRGIFRAAAQKPGEFVFKVSQIGTTAAGLYMANKHQNPEAWAQISDRDKVNNWIITTPFSYKDKDGTVKYIYFKVAKDQGQRVFATIFENLMAKYMGEDINVDQIVQAVQDGIPMLPTDLMPPSLDAVMGYAANKDFWRNEDIWRGPNIEAQEQYTRYTHPGFIAFGEASGLSPEKIKYALSQYFTSGNIYTSATGHAWNMLLNQSTEAEKQLVAEELVMKQPFIRRIVKSTDPYYQYGAQIKDINRDASTEKYMIGRSFDTISQNYYDNKLTKKDVKTFINSMPITERERLWNRHIRRKMLQELPDKRWWLSVGGMDSPEAKALAYWNRWRDSTPEKRKQMDTKVKKLPWLVSGRFSYKLKQLKTKTIK